MGKKTDRLYITAKEWAIDHGGYKSKSHLPFQRLPFNCCAVAFTPFEDPVCTDDGTVFDITNIVPYIHKHHTHPVTGQPLSLHDLIPLNFHKNSDGEYHCPVLGKVFTQHTHIVAVKPTGNVFCYEAIQELNAKTKCWRDLLTDEPFTRKDIIHIQDPMHLAGRDLAKFDHVQKDIDVAELTKDGDDSVIRNTSATMQKVMETLKAKEGNEIREPTSRRALAMAQVEEALKQKRQAAAKEKASKAASKDAADVNGSKPLATPTVAAVKVDEDDDWRMRAPAQAREVKFKPGTSTWDTDDQAEANRKIGKKGLAERRLKEQEEARRTKGKLSPHDWWLQNYKPRHEVSIETTGAASRSFTSTSTNVVTKNERVKKLVYRNPTKKAYLQLLTSKGALNLELHCDLAPRTCENFLALCEMGYYNNTLFHRSIRNFMIQGGDPSATGEGGESIYGKTFADEVDSRLVHDGRGVLAMANSGKDTNGSQFYILYKSARHLDYKHTVFGKVVGGLEVLTAMENVKTADNDRPVEDIKITGCSVYVNPYRDLIAQEEKEEAAQQQKDDMEQKGIIPDSERSGKWFSDPQSVAVPVSASDVAPSKIKLAGGPTDLSPKGDAKDARPKKKSKIMDTNELKDFDAW